ncbi:MAG: FtsW/RodA/SpoVE family cell cycle protein [Lachnospiraceae bacterium]|jgi:rod shape determining protein RodA|nr:FtsW/RodA/SpoVE family cell cycle protein [Lachnospiraceae bacterium]
MFRQHGIRDFLRDYDFKLIFLVVSLTVLGVFAVGSARPDLQGRQLMGMSLSIFVMLVVSFVDYHFVLKFYWLIYILNIILLGLVLSPLGDDGGGAQRWLDLKVIRFQPSELAKILLILFFAQFIMINRERLNSFGIILLSAILIAVPLILVVGEDLSTTIVIAIVFCVMLYIGGLSYKLILAVLAITVPVAVIFLTMVIQPDQKILQDYQQKRILAWLYPDEYKDTEAYQQNNSMMAIGSGQLFGKGYNNNEIGSVKNGNFISEAQTDFIFAIIGEEWGFAGSCLIIILQLLIALKCALIGWKARDMAGHVIAGGVAGLVCFQSFINMGVATGLVPNTGLPLPFVSYGLTSLVSMYLGIGFVLNVRWVSRRARND